MGIEQGAYWGIPHSIVEYITGKRVDRDSTAYWAGKVIGDLASMIQGVYTMAAGVGQELIGGGLDLTGVGAVLGGLELNAAGVLTIAYGGTVVACSAASMSSDLNMLFSKVKDGYGNNVAGNVNSWNTKGTWGEESLREHFEKHGKEVGAESIEQYLRKAEAFKQNLKGAKTSKIDGAVEGVIRYKKLGKYIDLAPDGTIVSFGKQ